MAYEQFPGPIPDRCPQALYKPISMEDCTNASSYVSNYRDWSGPLQTNPPIVPRSIRPQRISPAAAAGMPLHLALAGFDSPAPDAAVPLGVSADVPAVLAPVVAIGIVSAAVGPAVR